MIVTPLARNTWKGDGSYNDLLKDFAEECRKIGETYQVPVLDLNRRSTAFILEGGLEDRNATSSQMTIPIPTITAVM